MIMKRFLLILAIVIGCFVIVSCEKETMLVIKQTGLSFEDSGGSQSVNVVANKVWRASSNQKWCKVSPSSGDGAETGSFTLSVACDANTTLAERSCVIAVECEELTSSITITQAGKKGLILSQTEFNLTNEAQTITIGVQANVPYYVSINDDCKSWIRQETTGTFTNSIAFAISGNETFDNRTGSVLFVQADSSISEPVVINQSQTDGLIVEQTEFNVSYEEQQLSVEVASNIDYEVVIEEDCEDWLRCIQTKSLSDGTILIQVAENESVERRGDITIKGATIQKKVSVCQRAGVIEIEDDVFRAYCVNNFDKNEDGLISYNEAEAITSIDVDTENISSVKGIEYMPNLTELVCCGKNNDGKLTSLDVSKNTFLKTLWCDGNQLLSLDLDNNVELSDLSCSDNLLTALDIRKNTALITLRCCGNQLNKIDLTNNTSLLTLACDNNKLTRLAIASPVLQHLSCDDNQLESLSSGSELLSLSCNRNLITSLFVYYSTKLQSLSCNDNRLTTLEVRYNLSLQSLSFDGNRIGFIVLRDNTRLQSLSCSANWLSTLDLSNNTHLESLCCDRNELEYLHVEKCVKLRYLYCYSNKIKSLDVSNNLELNTLHCHSNPLLTEIWLKTNQTIPSFTYDTDVATIKYK